MIHSNHGSMKLGSKVPWHCLQGLLCSLPVVARKEERKEIPLCGSLTLTFTVFSFPVKQTKGTLSIEPWQGKDAVFLFLQC
jgi:hypothetical protein